MDTLKAVLNQILLFFEDLGKKTKRLPAKARRRIFALAGAFLLLVCLLLILCVSSCRSSVEENSAAVADASVRIRIREDQNSAPTSLPRGESDISFPIGVKTTSDDPVPDDTLSADDDPAIADDDLDDPSDDEADDEADGDPDDEADIASDDDFEFGIDDEPEDEADDGSDTSYSAKKDPEPTSNDVSKNTPEPGETYVSLKKHDKSDDVTTLQNRLMDLGYLDIDEPTNYFGTITETAVVLFQRQHGLKEDGIAGNETQTLLFSKEAQKYCLKEGAIGQDVKALQEQLVDLGYMTEKEVDSVYGPVTFAAIQEFQKRNNLHVDGLAGEKTLELLYSDSAKMTREMQKKIEAEEAAERKAEAEAAKKKATAKPTAKPTSKTTSKTKAKKTPTPKPTKKPTPTPKKDTRRDKFIKAANSRLGCEYVLGAKGPKKFDCSGFVYWCLKQAGIKGTRLNALGYSRKSSWKKITSISKLKKGDILFFRSDTNKSVNHTGIYVGSGNMIDASSGNGKVVKRPLSSYWKRNFVLARRPWT